MVTDTDNYNVQQEVKTQNPGLPTNTTAYAYFYNKDYPIHTGFKTLEYNAKKDYTSIAARTDKLEKYICIDIDGHTTTPENEENHKKDKLANVEKIKDELIKLIDPITKKYRIDKTASNKYHIWLKHPQIDTKELIDISDDEFITPDGTVAKKVVELFNKFSKHNIHLAGSRIIEEHEVKGTYDNIYAGSTFDKMDCINNIKDLITTAVVNAGYLINIKNAEKSTNTVKYEFHDAEHDGIIKESHSRGALYFSYLERNTIVKEHFYVVDKEYFTPDNINKNCDIEFKNILMSIYYYHEKNSQKTNNTNTNNTVLTESQNAELSTELINLYAKYWENTQSQRHYLILATSNVLVKHFQFQEQDLKDFYEQLSEHPNVEIDYRQHKNHILEGLNDNDTLKAGIPKIIEILGCDKHELEFLNKYNPAFNNEIIQLEKLKPTITNEIIELEKVFQDIYQLQLDGFYTADNDYIKITPTESITDFISQIISNSLYKEHDNITKLLLALTGVIIGTNRTYIIISGVSGGGKSSILDAVLKVIPETYKSEIDDLSEQAFTRHTEDAGKYAYDRTIIDYGDKGNIKGYEKAVEMMGRFQNLITKGVYTYRVTKSEIKGFEGTKLLTVETDGFAQIITTTKDVLAKLDEQLISRTEILYISNNSKKDILEFNMELGIDNTKQRVNKLSKVIQNHILYNLNKYNDTNLIIVNHWKHYIKRVLNESNGSSRDAEYTLNVFKAYCWLEIDRLKQVIGTDGKSYFIPSSSIITSFIKSYGAKNKNINNTDKVFIDALKERYEGFDESKINTGDIDNAKDREQLKVFTFQDIENYLKSEHEIIYERIDKVSDLLRKLEKNNVLGRLADNTRNRNVIYYMKDKPLSIDKGLEALKIIDDDINNAIKHLKYNELLNDDNIFIGKNPLKFDDSIDFSFIDQRDNDETSGKENNNDDNNNDNNAVIITQTQTIDNSIPETSLNNAASTDHTKECESTTDATLTTPSSNIITDYTIQSTDLVNLHCHTDESVGDGATSIEKLIDTAIHHNQRALALTNHGTLNGLYKFNKICNEKGIKPILGVEAYITEKRYHLVLLAKNYQGYQDLLKLHNKNVEYMKENGLKRNDRYPNGGIYYSNLSFENNLCKNLIALSGCISGQIPKYLMNDRYDDAKRLALTYNKLFNQFYLELQFNGLKEQDKLNELLIELSNDTGIPVTVTGDVHYIKNKDDWNAIKSAHRKNDTAPQSNNSFMVSAPIQLAETTKDIAESITPYNINTSLHIPRPEHERSWLKKYCYDKLKELNIDTSIYRNRLEKELSIIRDEIADYHILLYEIVETIKDVSGAIGGRGSAVGSLVCYLLGFHDVDPIKYDLLFERYLNNERIEKALKSDNVDTSLLPDIDLNIADDKRDLVFTTLQKKYKYIAKVMTYSKLKADNEKIKEIKTKYPKADVIDLKYNLSVHAGGVILSTEPFDEYLPVTLTREGEIITDCDLSEVEARGGIKYDLLGESSSKINEGITINDNEINKLVKYIVQHPLGISQFTGKAARNYLKTHRIKTFNDLLEATAIIRTGANDSWIFQEDMMQEATKYGVTMADADYLRKPRGTEQEQQSKIDDIIQIMLNNGCSEKDAKLFANYHNDYSFNKSHAVAYTLESLKNAKLKRDNTAKFFELKLNHAKDQITIAELFDDAISLGVKIIPPNRDYFKLDSTSKGNKLYVGTKFIKGISSKEPIVKGKFNKKYKEYLNNKSHTEKLYMLGAYDIKKLPEKSTVSLGYKTVRFKDKHTGKTVSKIRVATISNDGFNVLFFEASKHYKPGVKFNKGEIISDDFIDTYISIF